MNLEIINKWLENEFGVSYTRLEELHDFVVEQDLKHQKEKDKLIKHLQQENQQLKKQKDDVVELIKARIKENEKHVNARMEIYHYKNMLRMLGETNG